MAENFGHGLETAFGEILRPLIELEILKAIDEMDADFDFAALPRLFEEVG